MRGFSAAAVGRFVFFLFLRGRPRRINSLESITCNWEVSNEKNKQTNDDEPWKQTLPKLIPSNETVLTMIVCDNDSLRLDTPCVCMCEAQLVLAGIHILSYVDNPKGAIKQMMAT